MRISRSDCTPRYRPDIDGLRAIAVLGVIAYHAFPELLHGGFVGVDIFFAISGYLISGILYKGHLNPAFNFPEFYSRRIRRLFPALIVMLALSLAYGRLVLMPDEFRQMGRHVAAGTLFIQNFVFWKESGYFETAADLKPLQHLWSLAVEEQFYIVFPAVLIVIWKRPSALLPVMAATMAASFLGNLVMSTQARESDFFLTPYRAWEFLAGATLALWHFDHGKRKPDIPRIGGLLSIFGALLLLLGFFFVDRDDAYPGWRALIPVGGTILMIAAGDQAWINRKILSHPWTVWMGLISYPLYLFHWPALSFVRIVKGKEASTDLIWVALSIAFALAVVTYYLIEKPLRFSKSSGIVPCLVGAYLLTGSLGCLVWKGYLPDSQSPDVKENLRWISDHDYFAGLKSVAQEESISIAVIGRGTPRTLFLGDSHMQQYIPRLRRVIEDNPNFRGDPAVCVTKEGVPAIPGITRDDWPACKNLIPVFFKVLKTHPQITNIVIASQWNRYLYQESQEKYRVAGLPVGSKTGTDAAIRNLGHMIGELVQAGYHVTLMQNPPTGYALSPKGRIKRSFRGAYLEPVRPCPVQSYLNQYGTVVDAIAGIARGSGASLFDPLPYLSTNGICLYSEHDSPLRFDECHLRPGYVREHAVFLDPLISP